MNISASNQFQLTQTIAQVSDLKANSGFDLTKTDEGDLELVAKEFESLFMHMMLKSMRSANRVLSEGNYFDSFESKMYEDMLDEKLSVSLSSSHSLGIADLLVQQFSGSKIKPDYNIPMGMPTRKSGFTGPESFVDEILPKAKLVAPLLGVDPKNIVAQAALETGWGKHIMFDEHGKNSHNLFGIKANADWQGKTVAIESLEVIDGIASKERSHFKVYDSYENALRDYAQLLQKNSRYSDALNTGDDILSFGKGLAKGGYATDPLYAEKLSRVVNNPAINTLSLSRSNLTQELN